MAFPILASAAWGLLRKYGLKKLESEGLKDVTSRAKERMATKGKTISKADQPSYDKWQRRRDVTANVINDAGFALTAKMIYDHVKDMPENAAKDALKEKNPRMYKKWMDSDEPDVLSWLKNNAN